MSCCRTHRYEKYNISLQSENQTIIALAGNPNVGKSTLFNALTGLRQHTGNWPGKTVSQASGSFDHKKHSYMIVDLPGTYSLLSNSADEQVARDFICFGEPDLTLVVVDATSLERNLNLAIQVLEITSKVIVCVNLMDEAERKGIHINLKQLSALLGVPVVGMSARSKKGITELKDTITHVLSGKITCTPSKQSYHEEIERAVAEIEPEVRSLLQDSPINSRWVALRFIEGDTTILDSIYNYLSDLSSNRKKEVKGSCPNSVILN